MEHEDPRIVRSRALILEAATDVFLEHGYTGATVDAVAAAAEVAKRTIYNLYGDKDALFRAAIERSIDIAERFAGALADNVLAVVDPASELPPIGVRLAEAVLIGPVLPLRRLLVMESWRFPELAAEYRRRAPDAVLRALAELVRALVSAGRLRDCDPQLAAEHFAFLVMGSAMDRGLFGEAPDSRAAVRRRATAGAEAFLRAYLVG